MAITKNTVQVNNGNTGWTRSNVLDALEETFADLNWNSGSQQNGVVTTCCYPGNNTTPWNSSPYDTAWRYCGGAAVYSRDIETLRYEVTDTGTEFNFNRYYFGGTGSTTYDYLDIGQHSLTAGDSFRYEPLNPANPIASALSGGETVYVSIHDSERVKLHLTESDALAETNPLDLIDVSSGHSLYTDVIESSPAQLKQSDTLFLKVNSDLTVPLYIQDSAGVYDADREINNTNYKTAYYRFFPTGQGAQTAGNNLQWETRGWDQNDADDPNGYLYITSTTASYSVALNLAPASGRVLVSTAYGTQWAYWDYTVPADGTRSALNLRIYRDSEGYVRGIKVLDLNSSGWSDSDVFTIPGDQIGGATPANDITFGVNAAETSTNARDGIPSVRVTNIGSGVNSYLKMPSTNRLMLRLENDGTKNYGTTFWLFEFIDDYRFQMRSGIDVDIRNYNPNSTTQGHLGRFGGDKALDWSGGEGREFSTSNAISFASSSTPTAYPLKIVTYKAQAPQDTNFAIIQFIQTVNGDDLPYTTFFLNKGTSYGNGIWDLDYVWQGSYSLIKTGYNTNAINIVTSPAQFYFSQEAPGGQNSVKREALFGYLRESSQPAYNNISVTFASNQYRDNYIEEGSSYYSSKNQEVVQYFRNDLYDDFTDTTWSGVDDPGNKNDYVNYYKVAEQANYYRPIKGLPITNLMAPIPYYLPDDFVVIDFNINPGLTKFYPGDTVTISPSEVYEVVIASYSNSQTTYDGIASNSTNGILFCARTV